MVFGCIIFIGYIAWPLFSEKFYALCSNPDWPLCRSEWNQEYWADRVQKTIEGKTQSFFSIATTAISDILTDNGGKKRVVYEYNQDAEVYLPVPVQVEN